MEFKTEFDTLEKIYQDMCHKATNPKNFFFTSRYAHLRSMVKDVALIGETSLNNYVDVLMGEKDLPHFAQVKLYMCYPERYLKAKKDESLSPEKKKKIRHMLEQTVSLGFIVHLFLVAEPCREKNFSRIEMQGVEKEWASRILRTDRVLRQYNIGVRKMPGKIFDAFYKEYIEPFITRELHITGWLKKKRHYDFFHKLFFSGALLGLEIDFATRMLHD
ncbi:hypothetical protein SAMN02745221_00166 [Thermosyntropha lipolytica DSM 11003]|uniref:Uncharacterized protein n=1 Tax=Thermosyntropha lipolytica DSM 11003 TaxID=1123382 RepID=A0A1M5JPS1_9FIRM|nr:hypothetical protein [Thermosyntropha lipolytica]SHG42290.1 hypothetical protein SAMN02745221_00166 [Thermosyntropha lipolytica DSM 11003]